MQSVFGFAKLGVEALLDVAHVEYIAAEDRCVESGCQVNALIRSRTNDSRDILRGPERVTRIDALGTVREVKIITGMQAREFFE